MLFALFDIGTFWFWTLIVLLAVMEYVCIDNDWGLGATGSLFVTCLILAFFGNFNVFVMIWHHPVQALMWAAGYLLAGVIWSFFKWTLYNQDRANQLKDFRANYLKNHKRPVLEDFTPSPYVYTQVRSGEKHEATADEKLAEQKQRFSDATSRFQREFVGDAKMRNLAEYDGDGNLTTVPQARLNHKSRIMTWISYWPWSLSWTLLDDVIRNIVRNLFHLLSDRYQSISNRFFKNTDLVA